ncbi:MAG: quinoprotein dehydrogenase-associated putative ABC transporter substrate-binding protein [Burkholderiales bacterium]
MSALHRAAWIFLLCSSGAVAQEYMPEGVLKVCQDPNNLPFSNTKGEGFENKIAELFARKLGWTVEYASFPQRLGFIRNTLRFKLPGDNYKCDLVMGVPANYDQASPTQPYFRSVYALVIPDTGQTKGVNTEAQFLALPKEALGTLRIGVYARSPAAQWMVQNGLVDQAVPYLSLNADPDQYPGEIVERDLAAGKIGAALVWGPIAGFFAHRVQSKPLKVVPLQSRPGSPLDFEIAMGVRHEDQAWKARVQSLIAENHKEILDILRQYRVPLLGPDGQPMP